MWHVWLVPEFEENESLVVFKIHHVVSDGLGIFIMLQALSGRYDCNDWVMTSSKMSFAKELVLALIKPFTLLYAFSRFL